MSPAMADGGLLHPAGGCLPIPSGKKDVMDVFKTVLELALMLLKVLRELLALLRDKKNTRHDPTKD